MEEWATKEELQNKLNIKEVDKELSKLIDNGFVEQKGDKYRINNKDGKQKERINTFLDSLNTKYFPIIRHGYLHLKHKLEQKTEFPEEVKKLCKPEFDLDNVESDKLLEDAQLFEISEKTKWILKLTNNEIFKRNMPYSKVVIDCDLEIDGIWFKGFFIGDGIVYTYWGNTDGFCDNVLIFDAFEDRNFQNLEKHFLKDLNKKTLTKLKVFICTFFDFINNPEVRIIQFKRSKKNRERRIKQGKEPLPDSNKIRLTGTLKTYYEDLEVSERTLNYRFWVRGHFMRFWNKKRFEKLYTKLRLGNLSNEFYVDYKIRHNDEIIMKWIKPFIKGSGILITKKYEVKKNA